MKLSLFFPAYNEQDNIADSVWKADKVLGNLVIENTLEDYEIIVINDGSSDQTKNIVNRLTLENERIKIVNHERNLGYGAALWSGINASKNEWVFLCDADLQFDLGEIEKLLKYAVSYKVILGFRSPRRDPFIRLVNAFGWKILNKLMFNLNVRDIDCAFKLFERNLVSSLPLKTRGAAMSAEILIRLQRKGVIFKEIPVKHLPRLRGSPTGAKPSVILKAFQELFLLYWGELGKTDATLSQAGKFGLVGVINTSVDIFTYFILTRFIYYFSIHLLMAKFSTFFLGTIFSFFLNRYFTFQIKSKLSWYEIVRFYSVIILTVSVNVASLYFFNSILKIYDLVAVGLSTIVTFIIGFIFSKIWIFKKRNDASNIFQIPNAQINY